MRATVNQRIVSIYRDREIALSTDRSAATSHLPGGQAGMPRAQKVYEVALRLTGYDSSLGHKK